MKQLQATLVALGALVSAVPGYTSIQEGVGTPPDHGPLFGGTQIAVSALVLLGILLFRSEITRMDRRRLTRMSAGCAATFLVSLSLYFVLLDLCTVRVASETSPHDEQVFYFPIWPGGELSTAINQTSRQEVANRFRRSLPDLLAEQGIRLTATTVLLLLLHLATFASLVGAFALLSLRVGASEMEPTAKGTATRAGR